MDTDDTDRERKALQMLADTPQKLQALEMLKDSESAEQRLDASLEHMLEALKPLRPTRREQAFYKLLPWLAAMAGVFALYTGLDAVWSGEYCWSSRGSAGCERGLRAQLQGACVACIGFVLLALPVPFGRWRSTVFAVLGAAFAVSFLAYLAAPILVRT